MNWIILIISRVSADSYLYIFQPWPAVVIPSSENFTRKSCSRRIYIVELVGVRVRSCAVSILNSKGLYWVVSIPVSTLSSNGSCKSVTQYSAYPRHRTSWKSACPSKMSARLVGSYGRWSTTNYSGVMRGSQPYSPGYLPSENIDPRTRYSSIQYGM